MRRLVTLLAGLTLAAGALYLLAQTAAVTEDFQGFAVGSTPAGWFDDLVGSLTARPHGFFQVAAADCDRSESAFGFFVEWILRQRGAVLALRLLRVR